MLACLLFFFRDALFAGFHRLYGDSYDALIEVSILNHWYRVFTAGAAWDVTGYFAPYRATLGYNDTYILPGIPFTLTRLLGADPFVAAFVSHVAMKALGFVGMYVLLRRGFAVRTALALAGAALLTTANVSLLHMYHAQLLSVGLIPWLGFLALRTCEAVRHERPRAVIGWGCGFALLYALAALNAFYGIWFFSLFLALLGPIALLLAGAAPRRAFVGAVTRQWPPLLLCALVGLVALVPMLRVYLPKLATGARHPWENGAHNYLLDMTTLFDVGAGNLVWGRLPAMLGYALPLPRGEAQFGLPIGLLAVTLLALLWARRARATLLLAIGASLLVIALLGWRWPGDHSLWWYVDGYAPGASAIRVVSRFLLFALVGILVIVIVFLDRAPRRGWQTALLVALLLVEQVQLQAPLTLDRAAQNAMLRSVGAPPPGCDTFFVVSARPASYPTLAEARAISIAWGGSGRDAAGYRDLYRNNVDAMLLASYYGTPTINGFSSFNPPDWEFSTPDAPGYRRRVAAYARTHAISRLCGLDMRRSPHWFRG